MWGWIIFGIIVFIVLVFWLLRAGRSRRRGSSGAGDVVGDIVEAVVDSITD